VASDPGHRGEDRARDHHQQPHAGVGEEIEHALIVARLAKRELSISSRFAERGCRLTGIRLMLV